MAKKGEPGLAENSDLPARHVACRIEPGNGETEFILRPYTSADQDAAIALWLAAWQAAYPQIDFAARLAWWRDHWRKLTEAAKIVIAVDARGAARGAMIGFVTVEPATHYLDQLVVAPDRWGTAVGAALVGQAKRLSPDFIDLDVNADNGRALGFYKKHGFVVSGDGVNALSGRPVHHMRWRGA